MSRKYKVLHNTEYDTPLNDLLEPAYSRGTDRHTGDSSDSDGDGGLGIPRGTNDSCASDSINGLDRPDGSGDFKNPAGFDNPAGCNGDMSFSAIYDDYSEGEYYAGSPNDYTLHSLLTVDNARFWNFDAIYEAIGREEPEDDSPDHENLASYIETLFRQAAYFFDDDIIALLRKGETPITDPLMDRIDDDAFEQAKELRIFFFVDDPTLYRKVVVPMELRRIFAEISAEKDFDKHRLLRSRIVFYTQGMTILDGVIQTEELGRCLVQNGISVSIDELDETLNRLAPFSTLLGFRYDPQSRLLFHAALTDADDVSELWALSRQHPAYLPDPKTLQRTHLNPFYPVTEEYRRFEEYVSQWHFFDDEGACALFLTDFAEAICMGVPIQGLSGLCEDYDMDIEDDFDKFMSLVTDVLNTARRWDLRGNTTQELKGR